LGDDTGGRDPPDLVSVGVGLGEPQRAVRPGRDALEKAVRRGHGEFGDRLRGSRRRQRERPDGAEAERKHGAQVQVRQWMLHIRHPSVVSRQASRHRVGVRTPRDTGSRFDKGVMIDEMSSIRHVSHDPWARNA
jgi:hypothetical protein